MFTNNVACLQWKLSCVFTNNNKDQSEWRIWQGFMVHKQPSPLGCYCGLSIMYRHMCTCIDYSVLCVHVYMCWVQGFIFRYIHNDSTMTKKCTLTVTVVCAPNFACLNIFVTDRLTRQFPKFIIWRFNIFTFYCDISMRVWSPLSGKKAALHMEKRSNICCCARTILIVHVFILNVTESGINISCNRVSQYTQLWFP